jgi:hypothetical protein
MHTCAFVCVCLCVCVCVCARARVVCICECICGEQSARQDEYKNKSFTIIRSITKLNFVFLPLSKVQGRLDAKR